MPSEDKKNLFQKIPSVDRLLNSPFLLEVLPAYPRSLVLKAVHQVLEGIRSAIKSGQEMEETLSLDRVSHLVTEKLAMLNQPSLKPLINATGVVVHTNLGRSILPERVLAKFRPLAGGYSNLEYDLQRGERGSRYSHVEGILKELTGAEAGTVVNNNAAAVLVALDTLARGREVVVSRGQLVEIGGSFRIPEVMKRGGARMVEVGTTNKTHLRDYEEAIGSDTALLLKVHKSNYHLIGFAEDVDTIDLVALAHRHNLAVMEDLGSGCFVDFSKYGLVKEPTVQDVLGQGVDLVTFSGDKLLGGPQAGIILGRKPLVEAIRKNQLSRALRIDKLTLLALEETLRIYRDESTAVKEIPTLQMILATYDQLKSKARRLRRMIGKVDATNFSLQLADGTSKVGGGALPLLVIPTCLLALVPGRLSANAIEQKLRDYDPPIISRVEKDQVLLDVRTVQESELKILAAAIKFLAAAR
ncbi:MAG: L-seryl-tRNA(Sec) selenium transferase [Desulfobacterota bacterium]|nr:L-seryl-tRNA(Sec) selenium transferase [Thermodesulfobacteriota bacterium]